MNEVNLIMQTFRKRNSNDISQNIHELKTKTGNNKW